MSFKTAGNDDDAPLGSRPTGIELDWSKLEQGGCPRCGDELVHFAHVDLWKCTCGFKISAARAREIVSDRQYARGFRYGNYDQETPF